MTEPIIYELGAPGRCATRLPALDVPPAPLPPDHLLREDVPLPEVSEADLVRHYTHLSCLNYAVDTVMYPLGSCTMKYNPKVNEDAARLPGFAATHPYQPVETTQGNLQLMYQLQEYLGAITGLPAVSLQPAAGAQGELTGVLMIRAYHEANGESRRNVVLIPDSAHGTNPASTTMVGYEMVQLRSDSRGNVDLGNLQAHLNDRVAAMMLTNPNTLGLFDEHLLEITAAVHGVGALMYGDGANLNALMGIAKPAELGFDVMHVNLHKTFSTPHGGGGPGSGPVATTRALADYLPGPVVAREEAEDGIVTYVLRMPARSIGRVKAFYGHFGVMVRAYTYVRMLGAAGLRQTSEAAVLAANYLQSRLRSTFPLPYDRTCMHEFVIEGKVAGAPEVRALDISKRLIDYGVHPPTNYFPLIVPEALMIEPTETESKASLDRYVHALEAIADEARTQPALLRDAPLTAPLARLDEVRAARNPVLRWRREQ